MKFFQLLRFLFVRLEMISCKNVVSIYSKLSQLKGSQFFATFYDIKVMTVI